MGDPASLSETRTLPITISVSTLLRGIAVPTFIIFIVMNLLDTLSEKQLDFPNKSTFISKHLFLLL